MTYSEQDLELIRKTILSPYGLRIVTAAIAYKQIVEEPTEVWTAPGNVSSKRSDMLHNLIAHPAGEAVARMAWAGIKVMTSARHYSVHLSNPCGNALTLAKAKGGMKTLLKIITHEDFHHFLEIHNSERKSSTGGKTKRMIRRIQEIKYLR